MLLGVPVNKPSLSINCDNYIGGHSKYAIKNPIKHKCENLIHLCRLYSPYDDIHRFISMYYCGEAGAFICGAQSIREKSGKDKMDNKENQKKDNWKESDSNKKFKVNMKKEETIDWFAKDATGNLDELSLLLDSIQITKKEEPVETKETFDINSVIFIEEDHKIVLPCYMLSVIEETEQEEDLSHAYELLEKYESEMKENELKNSNNSTCNKDINKEVWNEDYEKSKTCKELDNFHKKLSWSPKQVIRYGYSEDPLLYSPLKTPKCEKCDRELCFEFQLMPGFISFYYDLTNKDSKYKSFNKEEMDKIREIVEKFEFATVLCFVCENGCFYDEFDGDGVSVRNEMLSVVVQEE